MGTFISQEDTPTLFVDGPKQAGAQRVPSSLTVDNVTKASDLNNLHDGLMDVRTYVRGNLSVSQIMATGGNTAVLLADFAAKTVNPRAFGAVGNGVADDTAAFLAAAAFANAANKTLEIDAGEYLVTSTIVITSCDVQSGHSAYVRSTAAVAFQIGSATLTPDGRTILLPRIYARGDAINTGIGVKVIRAIGCDIKVSYIANFADSLVLEADGAGVTYNTFRFGVLASYTRSIVLQQINSGYVNQNTFIAGRFAFTRSGSAIAGVRHVQCGAGTETNFVPDNNTFVGCAFEGNQPEFHLDCYGTYNQFLNCRWETTGSDTARVRWGVTSGNIPARYNKIDGGFSYYTYTVTTTSADPASGIPLNINNVVIDATRGHVLPMSNVSDNNDGGLTLQHMGADAGPALVVLGINTDPNSLTARKTNYLVKISATQSSYKAAADTNNRVEILHKAGTIRLGTGSATTDVAFGRAPTGPAFQVLTGSLAQKRNTLTYSTSIAIDASLGNQYVISATNGTAFAITAPTNFTTGQEITIQIRNISGGALGVCTFSAVFKMDTWVQPADTKSRSIRFQYNGAFWIEVSRTAADIPN